jgi:hypothetical protein
MIGNKAVKFASPQEEREAMWQRQNQLTSAAIPGSGRDDLLIENSDNSGMSGNSQIYEGELARLRKENSTLKDALVRSNRELKAFQLKYPSPFSAPSAEDALLPQWTAAPDVLNPLFSAYDTSMLFCRSILRSQSDV